MYASARAFQPGVGGPEVMHTTAQAIALAFSRAPSPAIAPAFSQASVGTGWFS